MENFQYKLLKLVEAGIISRTDFGNIEVKHDHWCARLNRMGPCNCDPEIQYYPAHDVNDFVTTYMALRNSYRKH